MPAPEDQLAYYLTSGDVARRLAAMDIDDAEQVLREDMTAIDPDARLLSLGEKPRGVVREIELTWQLGEAGAEHHKIIPLPAVAA